MHICRHFSSVEKKPFSFLCFNIKIQYIRQLNFNQTAHSAFFPLLCLIVLHTNGGQDNLTWVAIIMSVDSGEASFTHES